MFPSLRSLPGYVRSQQDKSVVREPLSGESVVPQPAVSHAQTRELGRRSVSLVAQRVGLRMVTVDIDATISEPYKSLALAGTYRSATRRGPECVDTSR